MSSEKTNGIIEAIMDDAIEKVASKGVDGVSQKTLTMACYKLMTDQLKNQRCDIRKELRPLKWLLGAFGAAFFTAWIGIYIFGG